MKVSEIEDDKSASGRGSAKGTGRWPVISLGLSMLLSSLGVSIPYVALPSLVQAFDAPFQNVQWIVIAYLLAITTLIVVAGRLGDMFGHRRMLLVGIFVFTGASITCAVAPNLWMLIGARVMQGVGASFLMALTVALVRETVSKDKTGSAMGVLGTISAIGTALGPSLGGVLIAGFDWRALFLVLVPLGTLNFCLAYHFLPNDESREETKPNRFDWLGTVLLGGSLAAYALATTVGEGAVSPIMLSLLFAILLGLGLFIFVEGKSASPLIQLSMFRNVVLSSSLIMNGLVSTVMMATLVVGPFYLSSALELNEVMVGLVMSVGPILSAFSGVPAGRLVDQIGAPSVIMVGLVALAAGALALSVLPMMFGLVGYLVAIAFLTPGYQLFQAANNTVVMMDIPADQRGVFSGLLSLSRNLGLITGASVMGAIFAYGSQAVDVLSASPETVTNGLQITFTVGASLIVIALLLAVGSRVFATRHTVGEEVN